MPVCPNPPELRSESGRRSTSATCTRLTGLLTLREMQPFTLTATPGIHEVLDANPIFEALNRAVVPRRAVALEEPFDLVPGLEATLFAVPGKVPLYLEAGDVQTDLVGEQTVGVENRQCVQKRIFCREPPLTCQRLTVGQQVALCQHSAL